VLEKIVNSNEIIIDRPKGTRHPKYQGFVYEVDYGYIKNTQSMDGGGIDVFVDSDKNMFLDSIVCIIDLLKKDSEIKLLIGCTGNEKMQIYKLLNSSEHMKAIMVKRDEI
jgi:inorganic pyrophosphatase